MEEVSFDDIIKEMESVIISNILSAWAILIRPTTMYVAINKCKQSVVVSDVKINTKYNTMDRKVKPMASLKKDHQHI